ncbi:diacylglycerol kinase, partial [Sinorhizobium meliloti]
MTTRPKIVFVVAVAANGIIGREGDLPWRLSTDLKRFKALTIGKPVVMGRKTWASLGRPLPGRPNIVISRNPDFEAPGAEVAPSLETALTIARERAAAVGADEIC